MRQQRTLAHAIGCVGVGLHSGARVGLTLRPAPAGSGVRFRRVDRPGTAGIPAWLDHVVAVPESTCLGERGLARVRMVEHLLAALSACGIDNTLIETSGPELPIMDGSALPFVLLIECAGIVEQGRPASVFQVLRPVEITDGAAMVRIEPASSLELVLQPSGRSCPGSAPPSCLTVPHATCRTELVAARDPAGAASPMAPGAGRSDDEAIRHAALDALGDLALIPGRLQARYHERGATRVMRQQLLRTLLADPRAWRIAADPTDALAHFVAAADGSRGHRASVC